MLSDLGSDSPPNGATDKVLLVLADDVLLLRPHGLHDRRLW